MRLPIVTLLLATLACGVIRGRPSARPLERTYWRLVELGGQPAMTTGGTREAHLLFDATANRVTGSSGCNRLTGPFTREGVSLRFGALASTRMACTDDRLGRQERDFLAALSATTRHGIARDTLTLLGDAGSLARLVAVDTGR
jgi:heat shock protein HslJ